MVSVGSYPVRGGILRGAAKKKKGQKKGRVVYKYVFGLLYEVFPIYRRDFTGPFLVFETRKKGALPRAPYNSLPIPGTVLRNQYRAGYRVLIPCLAFNLVI